MDRLRTVTPYVGLENYQSQQKFWLWFIYAFYYIKKDKLITGLPQLSLYSGCISKMLFVNQFIVKQIMYLIY